MVGEWGFFKYRDHCLLAGLSRSIKNFDVVLLQPKNGTEAYKLCYEILIKAVEKNLKFSKTKFYIVFSGLLLTCTSGGTVGIKPDPKHTDKLLSFQTPFCKEDIQSLVGMLGTLMLWIPNLSL